MQDHCTLLRRGVEHQSRLAFRSNHVTEARVISLEESIHHVAITRRGVFTCGVFQNFAFFQACEAYELAADSKVAASPLPLSSFPIHLTLFPTLTTAPVDARGRGSTKH